ncbi:MAG: 3-hydroxyacyl-[acyl-carrier-protein] dehydratase FabZ, partial [Gammaproteobacteria bacterium]|nr:3-hydroxyacyl-[acyl-carrier-protein] dehydratase FabZ [Gammaproteobacteria bacterium]
YLYYFVGADDVRLRRPVVPGDQLILEVNVITNRRGIYRFAAKASVGEELVGTMNILCAERKGEGGDA